MDEIRKLELEMSKYKVGTPQHKHYYLKIKELKKKPNERDIVLTDKEFAEMVQIYLSIKGLEGESFNLEMKDNKFKLTCLNVKKAMKAKIIFEE